MSVAKPIPAPIETLDPDMARRLERLGLSGHPDQWTERYLLCEKLVDPGDADCRQEFEATSRFIRDLVAHRWARTRRERESTEAKRIHYLSLEFLLGRTLWNNISNLAAEPLVRHALQQQGWNLPGVIEEEPDAGLGNGGLGRLAACFIDSLATLQYPAIGYGLRYEYGIFRQVIRDGSQIEQPDNWLSSPDPWEIVRPNRAYVVPLNSTFELRGLVVEVHTEQTFESARSGLRSTRSGIRRQVHQHPAPLGSHRPTILRSRRILARRLCRLGHSGRRR